MATSVAVGTAVTVTPYGPGVQAAPPPAGALEDDALAALTDDLATALEEG